MIMTFVHRTLLLRRRFASGLSLLGARGVHLLAWENFGNQWVADVTEQLKIDDVRISRADYGSLPDLAEADFDRDVVFAWNGTTSGVCVPDGGWIDSEPSMSSQMSTRVGAMRPRYWPI